MGTRFGSEDIRFRTCPGWGASFSLRRQRISITLTGRTRQCSPDAKYRSIERPGTSGFACPIHLIRPFLTVHQLEASPGYQYTSRRNLPSPDATEHLATYRAFQIRRKRAAALLRRCQRPSTSRSRRYLRGNAEMSRNHRVMRRMRWQGVQGEEVMRVRSACYRRLLEATVGGSIPHGGIRLI